MPESIKIALLQNAVKDIPQLSIVETLDEYTSTTCGNGSFTHLNYSSYYNLLINACVRYDATKPSTPSKRRNVYAASGTQDFNTFEESHETHFSQDIDTPTDDFYQVHQTKHSRKPPTPLSGFQKDHSRKPTSAVTKKPSASKKYDGPVYVPAEVYKLLSPEAVIALKKYNSEALNKMAKKRGIHVTGKKQTSVESSSFGSEFVAMKQCWEYIRGLRYKLRMMGIPVEGPTRIYGDNQSVLANTTIPDSTLKKKSQSIAYHFVCEGVARDELRTSYVNTHDNEADLLSKQLPHGEKRKGFVSNLLHHISGLSSSVVKK